VNILLPFDGSASSYKALDYAKKFVEGMAEYELIIVTVEKTFMPTPPERPYIEIKPEDFVAERIRHHEYGTINLTLLSDALKYLDGFSHSRIRTYVGFGQAADIILEMSELENLDLIIMCTHGMGAARRFTLGSVTDKVVHYSAAPILIIR